MQALTGRNLLALDSGSERQSAGPQYRKTRRDLEEAGGREVEVFVDAYNADLSSAPAPDVKKQRTRDCPEAGSSAFLNL